MISEKIMFGDRVDLVAGRSWRSVCRAHLSGLASSDENKICFRSIHAQTSYLTQRKPNMSAFICTAGYLEYMKPIRQKYVIDMMLSTLTTLQLGK